MSKYSQDFSKSARRHFEAARRLDQPTGGVRDVAGYLFGVAAECALKQIMRESGMMPLPPAQRREDPFYAHFPALKTLLTSAVCGRREGDLRRWSADAMFMADWDTDMRYAPAKDVLEKDVDRWREAAEKVIGAMGL